jgi:hypothetical protein
MEDKKITVEFAPGAFDHFDGTQEELDEMIAEIMRLAESGELIDLSDKIDLDELIDEDPEFAEQILRAIDNDVPRNLQ